MQDQEYTYIKKNLAALVLRLANNNKLLQEVRHKVDLMEKHSKIQDKAIVRQTIMTVKEGNRLRDTEELLNRLNKRMATLEFEVRG